MSYYTQFSLEIIADESKFKTKEQILKEKLAECKTDDERMKLFLSRNDIEAFNPERIIEDLRESKGAAASALDENGDTYESVKWYDWKEDLCDFSRKYPDIRFVLSGKGEESGDLWKAHFVNGKVQVTKAQLVYEEFDPKKLVGC